MSNNKPKIEIELDVFSGRPNPNWMLSEVQVDELKAKLSLALPEAKPKTPPQLGYNGFIIRNPDNLPAIPDYIRVFSGVLTITDKGKIRYCKDVSNIEGWLTHCNQARERSFDKIIAQERQRLSI